MESLDCRKVTLSRVRTLKYSLRDATAEVSSQNLARIMLPVCVVAEGKYFEVVDGHRRIAALRKKRAKQVSVYLLPNSSEREVFMTALSLNHPLSYSDLDRCAIFRKAIDRGFSESDLLKTLMPLTGLEPSPKLLMHYLAVAQLPESVLKLIRSGGIPFHGSHWLAKLAPSDSKFLASSVLPKVRPSSSQMAHIGEWLSDMARGKSVKNLFDEHQLMKKCRSSDLRQSAALLYKLIRSLRFPDLTDKETSFDKAAQSLKGGVTGLDFKAPDHFEREGFFVNAHIRSPEDLKRLSARLNQIQDDVSGLFDTIL